jgi:hypothetical protein
MSQQSGQTAEQHPGERSRGQGGYGWSPPMTTSPYDRDEDRWWLEREIESLRRALRERGVLGRGELRKAVGGRFWGPGRFRPSARRVAAGGRTAGRRS